jgi:hypothetical protein
MTVTITPPEFTMVRFSRDHLARITEELVDAIGITAPVEVVVNERMLTGALELRSVDPIVCYMESGALEDPKRLRDLDPDGAREAIGRLLLEANDRLTEGFDAPPLGERLSVPNQVAWDCHLVGRLVRMGGRDQRQRRLFGFRNKHGFSDDVDHAFERLWSGGPMTFPEIAELSDALRSARVTG